jgi:hypothetical protein
VQLVPPASKHLAKNQKHFLQVQNPRFGSKRYLLITLLCRAPCTLRLSNRGLPTVYELSGCYIFSLSAQHTHQLLHLLLYKISYLIITWKPPPIKDLFQSPKLSIHNEESCSVDNFSDSLHSSNFIEVLNVLPSDVLGGFL